MTNPDLTRIQEEQKYYQDMMAEYKDSIEYKAFAAIFYTINNMAEDARLSDEEMQSVWAQLNTLEANVMPQHLSQLFISDIAAKLMGVTFGTVGDTYKDGKAFVFGPMQAIFELQGLDNTEVNGMRVAFRLLEATDKTEWSLNQNLHNIRDLYQALDQRLAAQA